MRAANYSSWYKSFGFQLHRATTHTRTRHWHSTATTTTRIFTFFRRSRRQHATPRIRKKRRRRRSERKRKNTLSKSARTEGSEVVFQNETRSWYADTVESRWDPALCARRKGRNVSTFCRRINMCACEIVWDFLILISAFNDQCQPNTTTATARIN